MKTSFAPFCSPLHFWQGTASLFYSSHVTPVHAHNTLQLVFDLSGGFLFRTTNMRWRKFTSLVIKEHTEHQLNTNGSIQLIIYIDPSSRTGRNISARYLKTELFADPGIKFSPAEEALFQQSLIDQQPGLLQLLIENVVARITDCAEENCTDGRVLATLSRIRQHSGAGLSIGELANEACISPSRLSAIFKAQTGIPVHTYVIKQRLLTATSLMINGASIQQAAYESGFTDASHFTRTMLKTFKINPSHFIRLSQQQFRKSGEGSFSLVTYSKNGSQTRIGSDL